ncbi:hypothetical protein [Pyrobaculum neutrophilum]|uniref:Uncharacterized protein n=1 Tax=Pyrobaculum neutrophilum (strain DSM 2338 / JCM 9278 / NBRC 100436 / V24Sta) TaxID=444157 RepID=B1YBG1_PYRNV|nr:hypothetical protein [Pyrobaculum neutrophilum]ACB40763.1 conserved hypothetical protein [Pyrobaculum neutrophilum V24Sta]
MCTLYGREGYHALFLKPIAAALGCRYVALDYLTLYRRFKGRAEGIYYIEEPWVYARDTYAPEPAGQLPPQLGYLRRRMYPLLGNVHVFFTDGIYGYATEAPCGRVGLLAKEGEPMVTDLLLPLYLETGSVEKALAAAKRLYRCGLPGSREELVEGVKAGRYAAGYIWLAWAAGLDVELRPYPTAGWTLSGFWGLAFLEAPLYVHGHPPPYLERLKGRARRLVEAAKPARGRGWMEFVEAAHVAVAQYLRGALPLDAAVKVLREIENRLET